MKISKLIQQLAELQKQHGDIQVRTTDPDGELSGVTLEFRPERWPYTGDNDNVVIIR